MCKRCPLSHFPANITRNTCTVHYFAFPPPFSFLSDMNHINLATSLCAASQMCSSIILQNLFLLVLYRFQRTGGEFIGELLSASWTPECAPPSRPRPMAEIHGPSPLPLDRSAHHTRPRPSHPQHHPARPGRHGPGRGRLRPGRPGAAQRDPARLCGLSGRGAGAGAGAGIAEPGPAEQRQLVSRSVQ
jgi:hypothetical protein